MNRLRPLLHSLCPTVPVRSSGRALLAGLLLVAVGGCIAPEGASGASDAVEEPPLATTVIAVRHAEKAAATGDPELSEAGRLRAMSLARLLAAEGAVTHLFASEYRRTLQTLEPLAADRGLEIERYAAGDQDALLARLAALPQGSVAVVAGHSNTVPALVRALGGEVRDTVDSPYGQILADDAYDRLFVLVGGDERHSPTALELRYGD